MDTPYSQRDYLSEPEPLYLSGDELETDIESPQPRPMKTPVRAVLGTTFDDSDDDVIFDEDTPTPRPNKTRPFEMNSGFNSGVTAKQPFSPFKPSRLNKSTTWDELTDDEERPVKNVSETALKSVQPQLASKTTLPKKPVVALGGVARSVKPLTVPVEFKFAQRKPLARTLQKKEEPPKLQKPATSGTQPWRVNGVTRPVPFKFHERLKKQDESKSPYVPLAERVKAFEKTPARFKKTTGAPKPAPVQKFHHPRITVPKSPKFHTAQRIKKKEPVLSTEERQLQQIKLQPTFKARPVDSRILNSHGDVGIPRIKKASLTIPESPHITKVRPKTAPAAPVLSTEERQLQHIKSQPTFKARPVDSRILKSHGDYGVPRVKKPTLTVPESPHITKVKPKPAVAETKPPSPPRIIKARPLPANIYPKASTVSSLPSSSTAGVLPGDLISQQKRQRLEEDRRRKEEQERKLRQFKARPLYSTTLSQVSDSSLTSSAAPGYRPKPLTQPQSPALTTKVRGQYYRQMYEERKRAQQLEEEQQRHFQAQPIIETAPFVPEPSHIPPTDPETPHLHTDHRAEDRKLFDLQMKEREEELERMKAEQQRLEQERDDEERRRLRKQAEFKATPMLVHPVPFEPKRSQKPLTHPESPYIGEKRKAAVQQASHHRFNKV